MTQKVVMKEKVIPKTITTTTNPAFVLQGKVVPTTSATGSFDFEVATPPLSKPARVKEFLGHLLEGKVTLLHPLVLVLKPLRLQLLLLVLLPLLFNKKWICDTFYTVVINTINNGKNHSPSSGSKPTGASFNKPTSNIYHALAASANCNDSMGAL